MTVLSKIHKANERLHKRAVSYCKKHVIWENQETLDFSKNGSVLLCSSINEDVTDATVEGVNGSSYKYYELSVTDLVMIGYYLDEFYNEQSFGTIDQTKPSVLGV